MLEGCQVRMAILNLLNHSKSARLDHRRSLYTPIGNVPICIMYKQWRKANSSDPEKSASVILCKLKSQLAMTEIHRMWHTDSTGCSSSVKLIFSFRSLCENSVNAKWEKTQEEENNNKEEHPESILQWVFQLWSAMWTDRGNLHSHTHIGLSVCEDFQCSPKITSECQTRDSS